jgi:hypothetical protein
VTAGLGIETRKTSCALARENSEEIFIAMSGARPSHHEDHSQTSLVLRSSAIQRANIDGWLAVRDLRLPLVEVRPSIFFRLDLIFDSGQNVGHSNAGVRIECSTLEGRMVESIFEA